MDEPKKPLIPKEYEEELIEIYIYAKYDLREKAIEALDRLMKKMREMAQGCPPKEKLH